MPFRRHGDAAVVLDIDPDEDLHWEWLTEKLGHGAAPASLRPLSQVTALARSSLARTVVIELRYIDQDFRSEYTAFWAERFTLRAPVTLRVHFFGDSVQDIDLVDLEVEKYVGYTVIRPTNLGPIGRTLISGRHARREGLIVELGDDAVLTTVTERTNLFGSEIEIEGVPYAQQDGELLRCAHTCAWLVHYVGWRNGVVPRRLTGDIALMPSVDSSPARPLPSTGLTVEQIQGVLSNIGLPASYYQVAWLPSLPDESNYVGAGHALPERSGAKETPEQGEDRMALAAGVSERLTRERILRLVCPSLNSGFPVVVITDRGDDHSLVLVGWRHREDSDLAEAAEDLGSWPRRGIELIACDDQQGPYEIITDPLGTDPNRGRWVELMLPLPERVLLSAVGAETQVYNLLELANWRIAGGDPGSDALDEDLADLFPRLDGDASIRSRLVEGKRLKSWMVERENPAKRIYRLAHLPQWVWLVEIHDRALRRADKPCVLAEFVFDASSSDAMPIPVLSSSLHMAKDVAITAASRGGRRSKRRRKTGRATLSGTPWESLVTDPSTRGHLMGSRG